MEERELPVQIPAKLYHQLYIENHFQSFEKLGIYYLSLLGNNALVVLDELFRRTCEKFSFVYDKT